LRYASADYSRTAISSAKFNGDFVDISGHWSGMLMADLIVKA